MKISTLRKISMEDLQKYEDKVPDWVEGMLGPINELLDNFATGMRGGLSVRQNFLSTILELQVTNGASIEVSPRKTGKVLGVVPVFVEAKSSAVVSIETFGFNLLSNGNILIKATFDPVPTTPLLCRFIVLFDEV